MFTVTVVDGGKQPREGAMVNFFFTEDSRIISGDERTDRKGIARFYDGFVKTGQIKVFINGNYADTCHYEYGGKATITI